MDVPTKDWYFGFATGVLGGVGVAVIACLIVLATVFIGPIP